VLHHHGSPPSPLHAVERRALAHLVLSLSLHVPRAVLGIEQVLDLDVQVAAVLVVRSDIEVAVDLLALLYRQDILKVEDGLLPVGVLGVRASGETDGLVASREVDIKPSNKGVDEIVTAAGELEGDRECKVGDSAGVEIQGKDGHGVSHGGLDVDGVDKRLSQSSLLERGVIKSVDIVPDYNISC
jgi:hypothetical protein